ncbi:MAG: fimbria/pilus periplasmic chaperone [Bacteroides sp.]|nr:fimbria/pilus periplasmic chaperone [Bacteroides sp.]
MGLLLLQSSGLFAQGNLLITPRRVVFDGSKRSVDLNLANSGQDSATYAISLVQIRMTEMGGFETITEPDPGQNFADKFVRFFPRSVTLAPNEAQVVKIEVTRRSQLEEGEYRSHFYFRAVPKVKPLGVEDPAEEEGSISVKLTPVFGITIPVILRIGESTTSVSLTDLTLHKNENNTPNLEMTFMRSGNMSVYGDLSVDHISSSGVVTRVGIANGVAVYTPNAIRKFNLNLVSSQEVDFASGILKVNYSASSDVEPARYAEAELILK